MRLPRRRPGPADPAADAPAPPRPPRGAPVSAYAAILDGETLWLAVDAAPGSLALRDRATGEVLALPGDTALDTEHLSVRADLTALSGSTGSTSYDAVLVPPGSRSPRPLWTAPLPEPGPVRVPPTRDGRWQHSLARAEDGTLRVHREPVGPGATVLAVTEVPHGLEVRLTGASGELLGYADTDDSLVLRVPLEDDGATQRAVVRAVEVPPGADLMARVVAGTPDSHVPVRRRHSDLANPGHAAVLPTLTAPQDGRPLLRLRWKASGQLAARVFGPATDTTSRPGSDG